MYLANAPKRELHNGCTRDLGLRHVNGTHCQASRCGTRVGFGRKIWLSVGLGACPSAIHEATSTHPGDKAHETALH